AGGHVPMRGAHGGPPCPLVRRRGVPFRDGDAPIDQGAGPFGAALFRARFMTICVVDGQGGKIGSVIIARLRERLRENVEIIALGTNSSATENMMRARANRGASGE